MLHMFIRICHLYRLIINIEEEKYAKSQAILIINTHKHMQIYVYVHIYNRLGRPGV